MSSIEERVERGIQKLENCGYTDWTLAVMYPDFSIGSPSNDILSYLNHQRNDSFAYGMGVLGLKSLEEASEYGLYADDIMPVRERRLIALLDEEWKRRARLALTLGKIGGGTVRQYAPL